MLENGKLLMAEHGWSAGASCSCAEVVASLQRRRWTTVAGGRSVCGTYSARLCTLGATAAITEPGTGFHSILQELAQPCQCYIIYIYNGLYLIPIMQMWFFNRLEEYL